jgi:hypothetical protein
MTEIDRIEGVDRDLRLLADRVAHAGYDPRRTLRRLRWAEHWPIVPLVGAVAVVVAALIAGAWSAALVVAVLVLPDRIYDWYTRKSAREALLVDGDFFEHERANLERRVFQERSAALLGIGMAGVLAWVAHSAPKHSQEAWILAALVTVYALVRLLVVGPALVRELRDLGGKQSGGWILVVLMVVLFLAMPFLVLYGVIRRGVKRLLGMHVGEDE